MSIHEPQFVHLLQSRTAAARSVARYTDGRAWDNALIVVPWALRPQHADLDCGSHAHGALFHLCSLSTFSLTTFFRNSARFSRRSSTSILSPTVASLLQQHISSATLYALSQPSMSKLPSLSASNSAPCGEKAKTWTDVAWGSCLVVGET